MDDSGKLNKNENSCIFGGVFFYSSKDYANFINKYRRVINSIKCKYCKQNIDKCNKNCIEIKGTTRMKNSDRRRIFNLIKKEYNYGVFIDNSKVYDFIMNDKCAASTGRFAENACSVLGISIDELSTMEHNPANLSSTCAVFCESELIGLMASGVEIESIAAGINKSIAKRLLPLIKSFQADTIYASGGVANNKSLILFISQLIGKKVTPLNNPQFNGALGCLPL